ncbi:GtrA family protein [Hydrogenophaga sp.]|uniref:GtrA family protein n=1 Tax=Hydrogenophaga sp. TaxID=1904254 RepID=UPI003F70E551
MVPHRATVWRIAVFGTVAAAGVVVQLALLSLFFRWLGLPYTLALGVSVVLAMIFNFVVHNVLTFGDRRLRGVAQLRGLASFCLASAVGGVFNMATATYFFSIGWHWALSALLGAAAGGLVNYTLASRFTWKPSER